MKPSKIAGELTTRYCLAGLGFAAVIAIVFANYQLIFLPQVMVGIAISLISAWWIGVALTPIYVRYPNPIMAILLGLCSAVAVIIVGTFVGLLFGHILESKSFRTDSLTEFAKVLFGLLHIIFIPAFFPVLLLGVLCGLDIRRQFRIDGAENVEQIELTS